MGCVGKGGAEAVCIGVGGNDDGHTAVGFEFGITFGKTHGQSVFVGHRSLAKRARGAVHWTAQGFFVVEPPQVLVAGTEKTAVLRLCGGVVVGGGQQVGIDAQLLGGVGVEEFKQVVR